MFSGRMLVCAIAAALFAGVVMGYAMGKGRADRQTAAAVAKAHADNLKLNDEVIHGWAAAVDYLRARLRHGDAPRIPVPRAPAAPNPAGGADGRPADSLPHAGKLDPGREAELALCRVERQRLIEDCAATTIQLRSLQGWAR